MRIKIKNKEVLDKIYNAKKDIENGIRAAFRYQGNKQTREIKKSILSDKNKTGGDFFKGEIKSAPGEVPANQSGTLMRSISYKTSNIYELEIGSRVKYGKFLELGTQKMDARPFLDPVAKKNEVDFAASLLEFIDKEIKK